MYTQKSITGSVAIVVRRSKYTEEVNVGKIVVKEASSLQISGPSNEEMLILSSNITAIEEGCRLTCNCSACLAYKYDTRHIYGQDKTCLPSTEPLIKSLSATFNALTNLGYTLTSNTSVKNHDKSNSTTWTWIKKRN